VPAGIVNGMSEPLLTARIVDALYTEAMLLADEARGYFDSWGRQERDGLPPETRVFFSCEALRVTTRLMHVIAWLLTRRAVAAGEIDERQAAASDRRLGEATASDPQVLAILPETARALVGATTDLYARVLRLDATLDTPPVDAGPARGLLARLERAF
jgi:regulator of CtrA degradation